MQEEGGRQALSEPWLPGHFEQSPQIRPALAAAANRLRVHDLFAAQAGAPHHPPERKMKPQQSEHQFLKHVPQPVAPLNVQKFVQCDGLLHRRLNFEKARREENRGPEKAERRGGLYLSGNKEHRAGGCKALSFPDGLRHLLNTLCLASIEPQPAQPERDPQRAQNDPGHDYIKDYFCERRTRRLGGFWHERDVGQYDTVCLNNFRPPGLKKRQQHADRQQHLPVRQPQFGYAKPQQAGHDRSHAYKRGGLDAVSHKVLEPPRLVAHWPSLIMRTISRSSFSERRRSSTRWTTSGSAAPLKTRSTKSRTMARTTCLRGRADW